MKTIHSLFLTVTMLFVAPVVAQETLYDNGPDPGNIYGWLVNSGHTVANSFTLAVPSTITAVNVSLYSVNISNVPESLDWKIYAQDKRELLAYGSVNSMRKLDGSVNYFLFYQWLMQFDIVPNVQLPAGGYWLEVSNATDHWGTGVLWGENNGPSRSLVSGNIGGLWKHGGHDQGGSESFQILGFPE